MTGATKDPLTPLRVLFVEDAEDDVLLAVRALRRGGFQPQWQRVETAVDLTAALTSQPWDIVLSDYHMPEFDAPTALKLVQAHASHLPFIVISGTIGEDRAVELMRAGVHDYLMKDRLVRLPEAVRRELGDARIRQERRQAEQVLALTQERLRLAIAGSNLGTWDWYHQTGAMVVDTRCLDMLGYQDGELAPIHVEEWRQRMHPEDLPVITQALHRHLRGQTARYECEFRLRHRQDHWIWVLDRGQVVERNAQGQPVRIAGTLLDITERKRAEAQLALQTQILEQIAQARPLASILTHLIDAIETHLEGGMGSILLKRDDGKLYPGVAPHLPPAYNQVVSQGVPIGDQMGSCGTAAFRRQTVVVTDIATDPLWETVKHLALPHGLRACWSVPVVNNDGQVLATFAVYYHTSRAPHPQEMEVVTLAANLAKIAIEREQAAQALVQLNRDLEQRVKQRTRALQDSEGKLQAILNNAPAIIYVKDVEGRYTFVNQGFLTFFNCAEADILGKTNDDFFAPGVAMPLSTNDRIVWSTGQFLQVEEAIALGSDIHTFLSNKFLLRDYQGQPYALCGISNNISDRQAIQNALRRSEEQARGTLLAIPDLLIRLNREGEYLDVMASSSTRSLVPPERAIGHTIEEILPPDIAANYSQALQTVLTTQQVQSFEQTITVDGEVRYEEVRVAPCGRDEVILLIRDISERKRSEAALQRTNAELARATRLKDEFLANMSHELRTPLNAILGLSEGLQEEVFGSLTARQRKALATVENSGRHLLDLINDILDLSKIEAGKLDLHLEAVPLQTLCSTSLTFIKQLAQKKSIRLHTEIPRPLRQAELWVDNRRFRQVLINLLSNAVKFTPEGGAVTLRVEASAAKGGAEATTLHLSIIDTGIGIAPEDMDKLFQAFVQIDSSLSRRYEGTGLGLTLVKQIVEGHGGTVTVTSEVGQGSCFTLTLPGALLPPSDAPRHCQTEFFTGVLPSAPPPTAFTLLLAEDNPDNIDTLVDYLTAKGYHMLLANDGLTAIALTRQHRPDLILMDIQMPDMDGLEAIRAIRQEAALAAIPIIALTALAMPEDRDRCLGAGANEYLSKPVRLKQLADTIQTLLATTPTFAE
ncbi:MAG: response regulator [Cyanobacteria bacterium]|nr:response regulator [Cyanobacteriota bacterium]